MERAVKIELPPAKRPGLRLIEGELARGEIKLGPDASEEHLCLSALLREVLAEYRDEPGILTLP